MQKDNMSSGFLKVKNFLKIEVVDEKSETNAYSLVLREKTNPKTDQEQFIRSIQYRLLSTNYTRKLVYQLRTNCPKSLSTSSRTLQTFTQQETITPCLLFNLQSIYLHNLSPHMSSQPITSRTYQRLLYLLTNQIAHQGF